MFVYIGRYNFLGARACAILLYVFLHSVDSIHSLLVVFRAFLGLYSVLHTCGSPPCQQYIVLSLSLPHIGSPQNVLHLYRHSYPLTYL